MFNDDHAFQRDAFISHASEDKQSFVEPLYTELKRYSIEIWFDKFTLKVGDSLRQSIDRGLADSRYGVVVLSPSFFAKQWPQNELDALYARHVGGRKVILPIWHGVTYSEILIYSPLLASVYAIDSRVGVPAVARSLIEVIRPDALQVETSQKDTIIAAARLRQQLNENDPRLEYRITYGDQGSNPLNTASALDPLDIVASSAREGLKIEAIVIDKEAYDKDPFSLKFQLPLKAWERFDEAHRKGKLIEFGPDDGITIQDFNFPFGLSLNTFPGGIQRFIFGPSQEALNRKFRLKLTFENHGERQTFQYIEFETLRAGQEELEIRSCSPPQPFHLTLTLNLVARSLSGLQFAFSYPGHDIRKIHKSHRALRLLQEGGTLQILDLDTDQGWGTFSSGTRTSSDSEADLHVDEFIAALHQVALVFNEKITWSSRPNETDAIHLQCLQDLIQTGQVFIPCKSIKFTIRPFHGVTSTALEGVQPGQGFMRLGPLTAPPDFASIFGKVLDVGPYNLFINAHSCECMPDEDNPDCRILLVTPAEPLRYKFEKFRSDSSDGANSLAG